MGPGEEHLLAGERRILTLEIEGFNGLNHANYARTVLNLSTTTIAGSIQPAPVPTNAWSLRTIC